MTNPTMPQCFDQNGFGVGYYDDGTPAMYVWECGPVGQYGRIRLLNPRTPVLSENDIRRIVREELASHTEVVLP